MCGRYKLSRRKQVVEEYFDCGSDEPDWSPRYNIAPTQPVPVIRQNANEPVRELSLMRWGLIPSWAKDSSVAASPYERTRLFAELTDAALKSINKGGHISTDYVVRRYWVQIKNFFESA
jgi:putative SOS response-associated peptidase YedK